MTEGQIAESCLGMNEETIALPDITRGDRTFPERRSLLEP
jgi:hypothetical protein